MAPVSVPLSDLNRVPERFTGLQCYSVELDRKKKRPFTQVPQITVIYGGLWPPLCVSKPEKHIDASVTEPSFCVTNRRMGIGLWRLRPVTSCAWSSYQSRWIAQGHRMVHLFVFEIEPSWKTHCPDFPQTFYKVRQISRVASDICEEVHVGDRSHSFDTPRADEPSSTVLTPTCTFLLGRSRAGLQNMFNQTPLNPTTSCDHLHLLPLKPHHTLPLTPLHLARNTRETKDRKDDKVVVEVPWEAGCHKSDTNLLSKSTSTM